jgi:hypothetical protein
VVNVFLELFAPAHRREEKQSCLFRLIFLLTNGLVDDEWARDNEQARNWRD